MTLEVEKATIAEVLAEFVTTTTFESLPARPVEMAKLFAVDVIGCMIGASREPQARALIEVLQEEGGAPHSSVIGGGFKTSVMNAAFINGVKGHIFDFDDDHREGTMHPSVAVFPAVFALAEKQRASGAQMLRAFIVGLEVMIRMGESFLGKSYYQGFHPTGVCGVFGAAAGCAALLGLDRQQATYALGLAGSFASGTLEWRTEGAWQKPLQPGHASMMGYVAASLAKRNFIGARTIFEGPDGVIRAYSYKDEYDYGRLTNGLGSTWEMADNSIKVHACCRFAAPVADCALDLVRQGLEAKDVEKIVTRVGDFTIRSLCILSDRKYRPQTHVDAQFSLPYTVAVAIARKRTGVAEFKGDTLKDPEVLALADKVTWELDPAAEALWPKAYPATLVVTLKDGRVLQAHADFPKGDPENPVTMSEVVDKFNLLTEGLIAKGKAAELVELLKRLDTLPDLSVVADHAR
jgi:2-methylcitrate dehydratase PrpD